MHMDASKSKEAVSQAVYGTLLLEKERQGAWIKVQTPDGYQGWVQSCYTTNYKSSYPQKAARVKALWAHIYTNNDQTAHPPFLTIPYGTKIEVVSTGEDLTQRWIKVKLLDGKEYFTQSAFFDLSEKPLCSGSMIEEGLKLQGIPYLWGGKSSFGYDCSGLVQTLFEQMGIQLPRDAWMQAEDPRLRDVSCEELKKGDLLFFGPKDRKISHVGIYLGEGRFLHSSATNSVEINHLDSPFWEEKFLAAKRIF